MKLYEELNDGSIQLREMTINPDKGKEYKKMKLVLSRLVKEFLMLLAPMKKKN